MLNECQAATDKLRCELYATFECRRQQLPALVIQDTPDNKVSSAILPFIIYLFLTMKSLANMSSH